MTDFLTELREELLDSLERYEQAPRWRRPIAVRDLLKVPPIARRMVTIAVTTAAAIAVAVQLAGRPPELEQVTPPPISRLDGFHATGLVADAGSLWVTQYDISRLLRIDARTGELGASVDVGGSPAGVIAAAGAIWVHDWERGRLLKVDAQTNRIVKTLPIGTTNSDLAFAADAVWAIDARGLLVRIDPATAKATQRVPLGAGAPLPTEPPRGATLAAADNALWIIAGNGHITEVDARTGGILGRTRGLALPMEKARRAVADASGLWISSPFSREILHIDARTRRTSRRRIGGDPGPLAVVDGQVWVGTLHDTGALTRVTVLDHDGRTIGAVPVPHLAVNIAPAPNGGAWISFGENDTVSPSAILVSAP